jgi:hypothetical protein
MHTPKSSTFVIEANVQLNHIGIQAVLVEFILTPAARKKSALIRELSNIDNVSTFESCLSKVHGILPSQIVISSIQRFASRVLLQRFAVLRANIIGFTIPALKGEAAWRPKEFIYRTDDVSAPEEVRRWARP